MKKKILVLNGGPRANGNTSALIDEFINGAESVGHTTTRFNLQGMDIHPCLGCYKGGKNPANPCIQQDDMMKIYPVYEAADIVVLASPMYYWAISGQLKCAFDRLFAVAEKDPSYRHPRKACILLMAAEEDSADNFAPVINYYENLLKRLNWNDLGTVMAGGVVQIGDIKGHPSLDQARALGASIS